VGSPWFIATSCITATIGVIAMAGAVQGWMFTRCTWYERIVMFGGALCMILPGSITDIVGIVLVGGVFVFSYLKKKRAYSVAA